MMEEKALLNIVKLYTNTVTERLICTTECALNTMTVFTILIFISKSIYMVHSGYYGNTDIAFAKQLIATCVYISSKLVFP